MIKIDFKQRKREVLWTVVALFFIAIGVSVFKFSSATSGFEITDELGGNIFSFCHSLGGYDRCPGHSTGRLHISG